MNSSSLVKHYLGDRRVSKIEFDDFEVVATEIQKAERDVELTRKVFDWFDFLHQIEIPGWRTKLSTQKITRNILKAANGQPVIFYALFCPSYKKGDGAYGFRTDDVGETSTKGVDLISLIQKKSSQLGIKCLKPKAIFFDVAIEQPEKVIANNCLDDLDINVANLLKHIPDTIEFHKLSDLLPDVFSSIGYKGIISNPLPIPVEVFKRIVERGSKFYELFGWTKSQILHRSKIIASSEAMVGNSLRKILPNGIMIYTPTMLERAAVYSGNEFYSDPLPIIFPKK